MIVPMVDKVKLTELKNSMGLPSRDDVDFLLSVIDVMNNQVIHLVAEVGSWIEKAEKMQKQRDDARSSIGGIPVSAFVHECEAGTSELGNERMSPKTDAIRPI